MTKPPAATQETISVSQAAQLIPMVPHLLGFRPQDSLVVMCFRGKRLGPVMRVGMPPPGRTDDVVEYLAQQAHQHGDRAVILAYSDRPDAPSVLAALLLRMLRTLSVIDACVVDGDTASFLPDPTGRTDPPIILQETDNPVVGRLAAERAIAGRSVLPDRQAVAASIAAPRASAHRRARRAMQAARRQLDPLAARSTAWLAERADVTLDVAVASIERTNVVPPHCAAWLALLVQNRLVRDLMIARMLADRRPPWVPLLINTLVQVPADESEDLSTMLAVMAYRTGDGALAQVAVDRALQATPEQRLAGLMLDIMEAGMPPDSLDDLIAVVPPMLPDPDDQTCN